MNRMFRHQALCAMMGLGLLLPLQSLSARAASDAAMAPSDPDSKTLYWQGHEALKQSQWDQAIERFAELEQRLRRAEPKSADAALYWQAYAQSRAKRSGEAKATVERLKREFPQSRWINEAEQLVGAGPGLLADGDRGSQQELVDIALDGLMAAPPERALPLVQRVLDGNYAIKTKKRALFVLTQIDQTAAADRLLKLAQSNDTPTELRHEAVNMLGISGGKQAATALDQLYRSSTDSALRKRVLHAWMISDNRVAVMQVASADSDTKLRLAAVRQLGVMGAEQELRSLLASSKDPAVHSAVVDAFGIAGKTTDLVKIAGGAGDETLRMRALRSLGVAGAGEQLADLYQRLDSPKLRAEALKGLMISGDSKRLSQLYAKAQSDDDKRAILRSLSMLGDDAALDAIEAAIEQGKSK